MRQSRTSSGSGTCANKRETLFSWNTHTKQSCQDMAGLEWGRLESVEIVRIESQTMNLIMATYAVEPSVDKSVAFKSSAANQI
jgi:hypothetical protein